MAYRGLTFFVYSDDAERHYRAHSAWHTEMNNARAVVCMVELSEAPDRTNLEPARIVHIVEDFESSLFETIMRTRAREERVVGPECAMDCLLDEVPELPHTPTFNLCLRGITVCCTGIALQDRKVLHNKIQWLGGTAQAALNKQCNYLVAGGNSTTDKIKMAIKWAIPVVKTTFVDCIWDSSTKKDEIITKIMISEWAETHRSQLETPVLHGVRVTVSGLSNSARAEVKMRVDRLGGQYFGDLNAACSVLIAPAAKSNKKQDFARKHRIPIVYPNWLESCEKHRSCVGTSQYQVGKPELSEPLNKIPNTFEEKKHQISPTKRKNKLTAGAESGTRKERRLQPQMACARSRKISTQKLELVTDAEGACVAEKESRCLGSTYIYFSGIKDTPRMLNLRQILIANGGTRLSRLSNTVTHVIIGGIEKPDLRQLIAMEDPPVLVTAAWLVHCHLEERFVPTGDYELKLNATEGAAGIDIMGSDTCFDVPG
ncbi:hypothetical protein SARC_07228 [Sphaeroforma arctica JP610]|uniref:BRCT domain-containing protein n=1 Tax=Sphaeroforma arctica JP610 TaxID=667725 RepID=A0A0L0FUR1_9EUKA|nr:hypothetical protein SARC_07228 [Sphaeroforma arctica JP610]KNC80409.1 hypothetical protein SARC_07228 [Sphaeroforma arctica JP610]|eukprot:XP_014154311.1 hypothetical protein SARC_07228 [Sphaeroforma arctica JP610]